MPTILELFKGSEKDTSVKADKETLVEQETSGIRFRSAVDVNNPLIYGNEAIRITQRSTPLLEDMKGGTGGDSNGGLIGGKINQARDFVNSTLGIPETQTPSRIVENEDFQKSTTNIPITKDIISNNGTGLGKFLQSTGGGNPKTLGKQALGKGIGLAKDKLRGALFGEQTVGSNDVEPQVATTTNERTYSDVNKSKRLRSEDGVAKDLEGTKLDLSLVSPIYGVTRAGSTKYGTPEGQFGKTEYAFKNIDKEGKSAGFRVNKYSPSINKSSIDSGYPKLESNLIGMTRGGDKMNLLTTADYDSISDDGTYLKDDNEVAKDLIPFFIGRYDDAKKTPFRAILTGITENVTPSWNNSKFLGNPFPYYTYSQVERSTSFNLKIVCYNALELSTNWEKIEQLTKMAYPKINSNNLVNPPIIDFRLGDMYVDKIGFIETLTYTIPDNSTWETNGSVGFLPKFIEVAISIKFIEDRSVLSNLYGYKKSKAAIEQIKQEELATAPQGVSITGNNTSIVGSGDVPNKVSNKVTVTSRGLAPVGKDGIKTTGTPIAKVQNKVKSLEPKGVAKTQTPIQADSGNGKLDIPQSSVVDKVVDKSETSNGGETLLQAVNNPKSMTSLQAQAYENLKMGLPPTVKTKLFFSASELPANVRNGKEFSPKAIFAAVKGMISNRYYTGEATTFYIIHPHGVVDEIGFEAYDESLEPAHGFEGDMFAPGYNRNQIKG